MCEHAALSLNRRMKESDESKWERASVHPWTQLEV